VKIKRKKTASTAPAASQSKPARTIQRVISPATIPYTFWKQWNKARLRGEMALMFDMTHAEGPFRAKAGGTPESFEAFARTQALPFGGDWYLAKIKVDGDNTTAYLLACRGLNDPGVRTLDLELMTLHRAREGWRVFDAASMRKSKEKGADTFFGFDDFGIASADFALHKRVQEGFVRPDLADHPPEAAAAVVGGDEVEALKKLAEVFGASAGADATASEDANG
jgi:hypothetical protein